MNRMLLSIWAAAQQSWLSLKRPLYAGAGMMALVVAYPVPIAQAQDGLSTFLVVDGVPIDGFRIFDTSYVLLNSEFEYSPLMVYEHDVETLPELFLNLFVNSPDSINFTMESNFYSPIEKIHETYTYQASSISSEPVKEPFFSVGRFDTFTRKYQQSNPNPAAQPPSVVLTRSNDARVFRPVIKKIPYYIQLELLKEVEMFENTSSFGRYFEFSLHNQVIEEQVSRVATNMFEPGYTADEKHIACPVWYEFKFMGYVDGFPNGVNNMDGAKLENLPDGVTFVSSITDCGEPLDPGVTANGCAHTNGTKIAIDMNLYRLKYRVQEGGQKNHLGPVLLHELAHVYGSSGHTSDPANLMYGQGVGEAPYVDKAQCEILVQRKRYEMGFNGFEAWGN